MRTITKNQNRLAIILAFFISLFVVSMLISGITYADSLVDHINSVREKPLKEDKFLTGLAKKRCSSMESWSHEGYSYWETRLDILYKYTKYGIIDRYKIAGENLANGYANDKDTFVALQASPSHKANNESDLYQKIGVAKCNNKVGLVTVLLFAGN